MGIKEGVVGVAGPEEGVFGAARRRSARMELARDNTRLSGGTWCESLGEISSGGVLGGELLYMSISTSSKFGSSLTTIVEYLGS